MKRIILLAFTLFGIIELANAQQNYAPPPIGGWDSLKAVIEYPNIAVRASLTGIALVRVWVHFTGRVDSVKELWSSHEVFTPAVVKGIRLVRWPPLNPFDLTAPQQPYVVPIVFSLRGGKRDLYPALQYPPMIEEDLPKVEVQQTY